MPVDSLPDGNPAPEADMTLGEADTIHSLAPAPQRSVAPWRTRKEIIAHLSSRVVDEQRCIHVLQGLAWDPSIEEGFRASRGKELPKVDQAYWSKVDLGFVPDSKVLAFEELARDVERELGAEDDVGSVLIQTALQYRDVVRMLASRGTRDFYRFSRTLYGSPKDRLPEASVAVRDLGRVTYDLLTRVSASRSLPADRRELTAEQAATLLKERLNAFFRDVPVHVLLDESLLADATAGTDYVKIRKGACFSRHDLDVLEVHEGWVHLATTINGQAQPVARWLAKGPPRTAATQEGLAALMEIVSGRSHVRRAQKLNDRILAVDKAEDGANFLDVYEWYRTEGYTEDQCFCNARRVFRGGVLEGGAPFTKDVCYGKGLALNFLFLERAVESGRLDRIPLLFVGKVALDDLPMIESRVADGTIRPPLYLPPFINDLQGLATMLALGSLLSGRLHAVRTRAGANGGST